jgi:hypothetical protein
MLFGETAKAVDVPTRQAKEVSRAGQGEENQGYRSLETSCALEIGRWELRC